MNIRNSLLIFMFVMFSTAPLAFARADASEPKGFKFKPVRGEDWPESGEADGGNRTSTDDDGDGGGDRAPASSGMPNMKMNPDGTVDPSSFKQFF